MKHNNTLFNLVKRMAFAVLLGMVVYGCGPKQPAEPKVEPQEPEMTVEEPQSEDVIYDTIAEGVASDTVGEDVVIETEGGNGLIIKGTAINDLDLGDIPEIERDGKNEVIAKSYKPGSKENLDDYAATLEVTKRIFTGNKGMVNVWVGKKKYMPKANEGMVRDTTTLYNVKAYALIVPHADSCKFEPDSIFMPVDSTGSVAQFDMTPKKTGDIPVRAEVLFYDDEYCTHRPKPAGTQVLNVKVRVDYWSEIWNPVWKHFKAFWGTFIALFFAALLFVVRKFIKKKTGYSDDIKDKILGERKAEVDKDKEALPEVTPEALEEGANEVTEEENLPADE